MGKIGGVLFVLVGLNALLLSAPLVSAADLRESISTNVAEVENYIEQQRQAEQEWRENRQEFIKKKMAQYSFEQKYLADGD